MNKKNVCNSKTIDSEVKTSAIGKFHLHLPIIIPRSTLRSKRPSSAVNYNYVDITKQGLDTSVFALLSSKDECGKVNDLPYSEDIVVNNYTDFMETDTMTPYENDYYSFLGKNVVENAQPTENQSVTIEPTQPTENQLVTSSQSE